MRNRAKLIRIETEILRLDTTPSGRIIQRRSIIYNALPRLPLWIGPNLDPIRSDGFIITRSIVIFWLLPKFFFFNFQHSLPTLHGKLIVVFKNINSHTNSLDINGAVSAIVYTYEDRDITLHPHRLLLLFLFFCKRQTICQKISQYSDWRLQIGCNEGSNTTVFYAKKELPMLRMLATLLPLYATVRKQ